MTYRDTTQRVALATCAQVPDLDEDGPAVVAALAEHGIEAIPAVWDDPSVDWQTCDAVVLRSTWDYAERITDFIAWAERVDAATRLVNALPVLRWNTNKTYLRELADGGVPVVPTSFIEPGGRIALPEAGEYVVKPAISAGSRATARYQAEDHGIAHRHVEKLLAERRTVMVQPYLSAVDSRGETDLVYLGGTFSHAVRKGPLLALGADPLDALYAPETMSRLVATPEERAVADAVIRATEARFGPLAYARVDLVHTATGQPLLLELELTEPSLFLSLGPPDAPQRFAAVVATQVRCPSRGPDRGSSDA